NKSKERSDIELRKRLLELVTEREAAEQNNDIAQITLIDEETAQIERKLKRHTVARKRKQRDPMNEKARKGISATIYRAIAEIENQNAALAEHLKAHLTPVRFPYRYTADTSKTWETE
ncbi:hypothetical protein MYX84_14690, partial [Acidobacteria bacterium AH-259-O06]|nr:hypothetical protein [Acidobacteria bacterium AH-259-O06]